MVWTWKEFYSVIKLKPYLFKHVKGATELHDLMNSILDGAERIHDPADFTYAKKLTISIV
jgi:hypothetical protein